MANGKPIAGPKRTSEGDSSVSKRHDSITAKVATRQSTTANDTAKNLQASEPPSEHSKGARHPHDRAIPTNNRAMQMTSTSTRAHHANEPTFHPRIERQREEAARRVPTTGARPGHKRAARQHQRITAAGPPATGGRSVFLLSSADAPQRAARTDKQEPQRQSQSTSSRAGPPTAAKARSVLYDTTPDTERRSSTVLTRHLGHHWPPQRPTKHHTCAPHDTGARVVE